MPKGPANARGAVSAIGLLLFIALLGTLWNKIFNEPFSGDGSQGFFLSYSILTHGWPGGNGLGFDWDFWLFTIPNAVMLAIMGPVEAAVRLPGVAYVLVIYACGVGLISTGGAARRPEAKMAVAAGWALYLLWVTNIFGAVATYHPYVSDFAQPATADLHLVMWLFVSMWAWVERRPAVFVLGLVGMSLSLASGKELALILGATGLVFFPERRKSLVISGGAWVVALLIIMWLISFGPGPGVEGEFGSDTIGNRIVSWLTTMNFKRIAYWGVHSALFSGLTVVTWAAFKKFDHVGRWVAVSAALYILSVVLVMGNRPHYYMPFAYLAPVPFLRWLSTTTYASQRRAAGWALAVTLGLVALTLPAKTPYTRSRDAAEHMLMLFVDDSEAVHLERSEAMMGAYPGHFERLSSIAWGENGWVQYYYITYLHGRSPRLSETKAIPEEVDFILTDGDIDGLEGRDAFQHLVRRKPIREGEPPIDMYVRDYDRFWADRSRPSELLPIPLPFKYTRYFKPHKMAAEYLGFLDRFDQYFTFADTEAGRAFERDLDAQGRKLRAEQ